MFRIERADAEMPAAVRVKLLLAQLDRRGGDISGKMSSLWFTGKGE